MAVVATSHDAIDARPVSMRPIDPHVIVLFGVTGDLARRKLLPGLFHLYAVGLLPEFRIVGCFRGEASQKEFQALAREATDECGHDEPNDADWDPFAERLTSVDISDGAEKLTAEVAEQRSKLGDDARLLHYLSVPPKAVDSLLSLIADAGLNTDRARIILEKPFGHDLASARTLNSRLHEVFSEDQIFRIDHYLGKEAAQNILALRFANGLFEPIWNLNHIEQVQIDVPETLGVEDRAEFYEETGAFRDMIVTHLFQILAFVAMEPPTALEPDAITIEKNKVFRSLQPLEPQQVIRGQYEGYHFTEGVDPRVHDRDLRRPQVHGRQLALGRRPLLPAHGQAHGGELADHLDRLPRAAEEHVPRGIGRRRARPRPPHLRPRRELAAVALLLRQEAGARLRARQAEPPVLADRGRPRRHPRGLRAPDPRRDAR